MAQTPIHVSSGQTEGAHLNIEFAGQDAVIPFSVAPLDVRGRAVQLGPMLDSILDRHDYPVVVARLLAETITLTVLLGTALKFEGKFIVQTQTDGPVSMIVTDFRTPGSIRAYARYDEAAVTEAVRTGNTDAPSLLGTGILGMTIDQGEYTQRYQGIVQLDGIGLEEVARRYFRQSEQIPTEIRLGVGEVLTRNAEGNGPSHSWTAGGVLLQFLPDSEERMRQKDLHGGDGAVDDDGDDGDDAWLEATALMGTIADVELTDAAVQPERLLFRLFNEHGVRVFDAQKVADDCSCSEDKVRGMLEGLTADQQGESAEDGAIQVDCEFCSKRYRFAPDDLSSLEAT
ncbi:Hsp33 family molecular chaperone [Ahrensia sp. R2A130]|uniref:Hsp33 family molecular chaperone n=1 Tax=Ahrensia sp. R2A130 TaxID=744979 RepID=UPI0001E0F0C7|nr:Hsp33 family molecular chaperone [Ahrensia sp. R2A130]EFL89180.1 chaperonin HslO [Ahrensia sp. R2A130]